MLNDHEWATLRDIERRLLAEDATFARVFEARSQRLHRRPVRLSTLVIAGVAVSLGCLVLVTGSDGGALAVVTMTVLIGLVWRSTDDGS